MTLRGRLHRRKANRERKRRLKQGGRARREARAVRKLRKLIAAATAPRKMYDAVTIENIPANARAVAGYVNGRYTTYGRLVVRWPNARHVSIAVASRVDADCLDVEPGDATNGDAAAWFHHHRGRKPIFYTSASNVSSLTAELWKSGINRDSYVIWSAHYTDYAHVCSPGACGYPVADATQWTTHGETLDESRCTARFWDR